MKKYLLLIFTFLALLGCNLNTVEITGFAAGKDGAAVSILDINGKTLFSDVVAAGKFSIKTQLPASGYYTFSLLSGPYPNDYEIYLESGKYTIDIPQKEADYLRITTTSKTQNKLSAYYNFENNLMAKYRQEADMWKAKLNDPNIKDLPEAEYQNIVDHVESTRKREHGLHIAAIDMFIKKYPQNDIVPHIITNMDYQTDPYPYYMLYKKLSPEVRNSEEGKKIGKELERLVKESETKDKNTTN